MKRVIQTTLLIAILLLAGCGRAAKPKDVQKDLPQPAQSQETVSKTNEPEATPTPSEEIPSVLQGPERVPIYQEYVFAGNTDPSQVSQEDKDILQKFINDCGDPKKGEVTIEDFGIWYIDDVIRAGFFFRNGTDSDVTYVDADLNIEIRNEIIASCEYVFTGETFGKIRPGESMYLQYVFDEGETKVTGLDLEEAYIDYHLTWK